MTAPSRQKRSNDMRRTQRDVLIVTGIFLLALIVRLVHLWTMRSSPFFDHLVVDSVDFDARAMAIVQGSWREEGAFYQAPLYPLFLAAVYKIFGHSLPAVRSVQAVLGSLTAVLVYLIGRRIAGRSTGVIAGILAALYTMSIHFDSEILRPSLVMFLSMLCLHIILSARSKGHALKWAAAGLLLGLVTVARPTFLLFIPPAVMWVVLAGARGQASRVRANGSRTAHSQGAGEEAARGPAARGQASHIVMTIVFIVATLLPVAVVTGINYSRSHNFVLISYNGGINFFLGNNANYEETISIRPGIRWDLLYYEPRVDPVTHPVQWSRYYYGKAVRYMRGEPGGYAKLLVKKLLLFWNGHEIERNMSFSHAARYSPFMAFPGVSFRWIAPLGLVGLILAWRRRAGLGLPVLLLASQMAAVVAFFVCARYRMVAVPVLIIFAAYASVILARELHRRWKGALPYLAMLAAAAILVNVDWYHISHTHYARDDYELALVLRREGRLQESVQLLQSEKSRRAADPDVPFQMGVTLLRLGENDQAAEAFAEAAALEPKYALSWFNLGISHMRRGDSPAAVEAYEKALEVNPSYWEAAHAVGRVLEEAGRYEAAAAAYGRSLTLARSSEEKGIALGALGIVCAKSGRYELSLDYLDEAIKTAADPVSAYLNKARVLKAMGRVEEALQQVEQAAGIAPEDERINALRMELRR